MLDFEGLFDVETCPLTTGVDVSGTLVGSAGTTSTAGDDTFNANLGTAAGVTTATTGDILDGGAGVDTLNYVAVDGANPGLMQTTRIENFTVRALGDVTADALLMNGYESFISSGSSSDLTVNNASIAATHGVKNSISGNTADLTVNFRGTDVAGAADVAKISLENTGSSVTAAGATSATVTRVTVNVGAGAESISLATTGTNFATVNGQTTTESLVVTGNGTNNISVGTLKATSTLNASASTGTNTFALGSALTTGDAILGGTGADTVSLTANETATVTMSGVESLQVDGGTRTTTFSANPALTNLNIRSASDAITVAGLTTLSNVNYQGTALAGYAGASGNVTLNTNFAGAADSVAVNIGNRGVLANGSYNAGTLTVSGVESVTVNQADMNATGTTTFSLRNTGMKTIAATTAGSLALTLNTKADSAPLFAGTASTTGSNSVTSVDFGGVAGSSSSLTFDAGTFAAAATVKAAVGGSTFVTAAETVSDVITFEGGAGVDSFTTGTIGSYVATLGGGATNTFDAAALVAAVAGSTVSVTGGEGADTITGGANIDTITGGAGDDIITGGRGADILNGGLGADTYRVAVGVAAVSATAEVQTITATLGGTPVTAGTFVINILGTSVNVAIDANPTADEFTAAATSALNSISGGRFLAVNTGTGVVTVTYATALGDVAPATVNAFNGTAAAAAVLGATTNIFTITVATGTPGVTAAIATTSDSTSTALDQLTYVTGSDIIDVVAGSIVITGVDGGGAATAGNASITTAGLATFHADDDTLSERITAVAADLDGTAAVREAAVFVHAGQGYLYISDGVAGHTDGDALIQLSGISAIATGITLTTGNITAIA